MSTKRSSHTPGPWVLGSDRTQILQRNTNGPFRQVASSFSPDCIDGTGDHSILGPEMYANARLIAAAPCLLEALKELMMRGVFHNTSDDKRVANALRLANEAIAKAEGGGE